MIVLNPVSCTSQLLPHNTYNDDNYSYSRILLYNVLYHPITHR